MYEQRQFGDVRVHRILDQEAPFFDPLVFFPDLKKEILEENLPWFAPKNLDPKTGKLILAIQSYVIQTPHHIILIDSCVGNDKPRPTRPFWHMMKSDRFETALLAAGFRFEDIDYVMCTHLHVDHVGWNTKLDNGRWVPTFPNAKYLFADRELEFWSQRHREDPEACPWVNDSVLPIVEAKRSEVVQSNYTLNELVQLVPTPGHTIDHYSVHIGRPGADALITGDMVHSPLQVRYPDLGMMADYSSTEAANTRRRIFDKFCDTSTLLCTAHFPSPSVGRIESSKGAFQFSEC